MDTIEYMKSLVMKRDEISEKMYILERQREEIDKELKKLLRIPKKGKVKYADRMRILNM